MIRDGIKSVHKLGICHETTWVYDITKFTQKPSPECYQEALKSTCKEYARVPQTLEEMKGCINEGFPYVFGFLVLSACAASRPKRRPPPRPARGRCSARWSLSRPSQRRRWSRRSLLRPSRPASERLLCCCRCE